jgi:beta-mannosidase
MHLDLNGTWQLRWYDGERGDGLGRAIGPHAELLPSMPAKVPGEVHLDLMAAGLLAEPTVGLNNLAARWVEETVWYYRRTFSVPALAPGERASLLFAGLDLDAQIYLNGQCLGHHANAFYPCRVDATQVLRPGENTLVVAIESGLFASSQKDSLGYGMKPASELAKRNWLRKTQSSFAWDWSARLLNVGIFGDVSLDITSGVRLDRLVALAQLSSDLHQGTVTGRVFVDNPSDQPQTGTLTVAIDGTDAKVTRTVEMQPGLHSVEADVQLAEPELWWPVGHGAQPLYTVCATLEVGGQVVGSDTRRVGFRHVRVNQEPHPQGGRYFVIEINGKPIFAKGGNLVPADMILYRPDRARYATLIDRALEANSNILRIWGGGLYETDDFYELCDEKGVMVWQEFIFACAKYPATDPAFLADIKREAAYQVRRLAHHASLVVWCGNNEKEWGEYNWGYEQGVASPDYAVFHRVLPVILAQEDGTRYYQPSSPYSPDCLEPNREDVGDQHPWSVGFEFTDFRAYRSMICRFPNEGGILGPTALPTVRACLAPGQEHPHSFSWEQHENSVATWGDTVYPDNQLVQWLGKPIQSLSIEEYVYWAGVVQGEGLTEYIRNFRRRMFSTSSAIFWMYNDCWPAVRSWTIVDYYLRRTPAFWPVRRAFAPLTVALAVEEGQVKVFGVNEGPAWRGELRWGLLKLAGGYPRDLTATVELPANSSTLLGAFDLAEWQRLGETTHCAFALLTKDGREVARDKLLLPFFKEVQWPPATVKVLRKGDQVVLSSDTFAWRVCLDLDGETALPDNFFDVYPGIPTVLDWPAELGEPKVLYLGNDL